MSQFTEFCANATNRTDKDYTNVLVNMNLESLILGVVLLVGSVGSTLPQHLKIWKARSVEGLSWLWIFLTGLNQLASVVNAVVLKFPQEHACVTVGILQCVPSLLMLLQIVLLWVFTFPVYFWYIHFTEKDKMQGREYILSRLCMGLLLIWDVTLIGISSFLLYHFGECSETALTFGKVLGYISTGLTFCQWAPQIWNTFRSKSVGTFSKTMLLIQAPGSLIIIIFMIFITHEDVTTYLSYISATVQQVILLVLLFIYDRKSKHSLLSDSTVDSTEKQALLVPPGSYDF
eukprot:TRINITY_DN9622_c0_g1_i1.p1 TRINITY_DN9622_c0_g1~~TRINITY_DN9622_c0_g1_i1.p1  ORF type:complete len:289 (+),score=29.42 TRINITY_DN9622_c0_g1_i1:139-1005(+)